VTILIVEDSPTQAVQLEYILEQNGYEVFVAHNGKEALA
jgi:DNA-binding response OmpR family regulator